MRATPLPFLCMDLFISLIERATGAGLPKVVKTFYG